MNNAVPVLCVINQHTDSRGQKRHTYDHPKRVHRCVVVITFHTNIYPLVWQIAF